MNNIINITVVALTLTVFGCSTPIVKTQIVTVDKPVAFVPKPPTVPQCEFYVDKLVSSDLQDPGKIGQYYKHDMMCLRRTNSIYQQILDQYQQSSQDFDKINEQIDLLMRQTNNTKPSN